MRTIFDVVSLIQNDSITEKEKGTKFESACLYYLQNDPYYASVLDGVWMWENCPLEGTGGQDVGIDLVACDFEGRRWAIQCKCYDGGEALPKAECDSFIATALAQKYDKLVIMTSAGKLAPALSKIAAPAGVQTIFTYNMDASKLDWDRFVEGNVGRAERKRKELREHQADAVKAIKETFADRDRCKAIMACGTGKTFMSLRLAEDIAAGGVVLFCPPSTPPFGHSMRS